MPTGTPRNKLNAEQQAAIYTAENSSVRDDEREIKIIRAWTMKESKELEAALNYRKSMAGEYKSANRDLDSLRRLGSNYEAINTQRDKIIALRESLDWAESQVTKARSELKLAEERVIKRIQRKELK